MASQALGVELAQSIKFLLCKFEDLGLIPRTHGKVVGMGACACNCNSGEVETGTSLGLVSQPI